MEVETDLRVHSRRGYWIAHGLGALALAVACGLALRTATGPVVALGGVGLLMFGFFAGYAARQGLRRKPRLVLTPAGFEADDLRVGLIPWHEVAEVEAFGSSDAPFVAFLVPQAARYVARMPWWPRLLVRILRSSGLPMFSINLIGTDRAAWIVAERAEALRRATT